MKRIVTSTLLGLAVLFAGQAAAADKQAPPRRAEKAATADAARNPAAVAAEIDRLIAQQLTAAKVPASPRTDDGEFLRRATLDITGRIPTAQRAAAFLNDTDPNKRAKLIDELLADREYGEHFGIIWYHRMIKPDDDNRGVISQNMQTWLAERFNQNQGWDRLVSDILTASGSRERNPATVFWLANVGDKKAKQPEPNKVTAAASRLFLGVKLECCECHNHPFTTLKQTDFWGTAAFFAATQVENGSKKDVKAGAIPVVHEGRAGGKGGKAAKKAEPMAKAPLGSIVIPDTKGKTVKAKYLGGAEPSLAGKAALRPVFAAWVTSPQNPFFARAAVNKMWANFFGRGIIDPVDDMRPENDASHPEILKLLSDEFTASRFDLKHLIRCICNSETYQRTSAPLAMNKSDEKLYSHMPVKVMSADMLYDSLALALGHTAASAEKGTKKNNKYARTPRDQFRKFFHAEADDDVGVVEDYTHGIPQALRLMNSQQINDTTSTVNRLLKEGGSPEKIIDGLFLTTLSRRPTATELRRMKDYVAGDNYSAKSYGDLMWVLLNSAEFLFNH